MMQIKPIAYIKTDFPTKFGIPRQPGVVANLQGSIIFEQEFANPDCIRGLEEFSHLWLIWGFSENLDDEGRSRWSPTVRPPRLGGNKRLGVFATRSPFRPNPIGMSAVKIEHLEYDGEHGPVIHVLGADMVDGTPIYDIKPYIPYADSIPEALGGFTDNTEYHTLKVTYLTHNLNDGAEKRNEILTSFSESDEKVIAADNETDYLQLAEILSGVYGMKLESRMLQNLTGILENDPRPHYQRDPDRIYGLEYAGYEIKFRVSGNVLTVTEITR